MKKLELFFSFLLVPVDFIMILLAGTSAYYLRFAQFTQEVRPVIFNLPFGSYLKILVLIGLAWLIIFALSGLYAMRVSRSFAKESYRVILAASAGFMFIVIYIFFQRELFNSRFIVLVGWLLAILYIIIARGLIRYIEKLFYWHGNGVRRIVLIGDSQTTETLIRYFSLKKTAGYTVVKRLKDFDTEAEKELTDFIKGSAVDEVIQTDPNLSKSDFIRLYNFADEQHLIFKYAADLLDTKVLRTEVTEVAGVPIIEVIKTNLDGWGRITKRILDIIGSLILIIITSPIVVLTALLIKIDSKGPVFFSRRDDGSLLYRVGQGGKPFRYFKFRSMMPNTDSMRYTELADQNIRTDGPMVKIKDDPRITRVGKIIRRWSIDELVELFLVLKGDMSLVGPRPHLPEEVAKYEHHHKKVLTIKPGITGLAQISGRSDLSFEEEVKLDTYYIENWSILLDISILLKTPLAVVRGREAA